MAYPTLINNNNVRVKPWKIFRVYFILELYVCTLNIYTHYTAYLRRIYYFKVMR